MARTLTAAVVTEITSDSMSLAFFLKLAFDSGDVNVWTGTYPKTFGGDTYTGVGDFASVSPIGEGSDLKAFDIRYELSGIPSGTLALALLEPYMGRTATLWLAFLDENEDVIADALQYHKGMMDGMDIIEGPETATVVITSENILRALERPAARYINAIDQRILYPWDLGFDFLTNIQQKEILWGNK